MDTSKNLKTGQPIHALPSYRMFSTFDSAETPISIVVQIDEGSSERQHKVYPSGTVGELVAEVGDLLRH